MEQKKEPKPKIKDLTPDELAKVTDLIKAVGLALNQISLYTAKHRISLIALEQAFNLTDNYLSLKKELNLSVTDDKLLVETTELQLTNPLIANFVRHLKKLQVASVTFRAGLNQAELISFLELLLQKIEKKEMIELETLLTERKITHILLNKAIFVKAVEGEKEVPGKLKKAGKIPAKEMEMDEDKLSHFLIGLVKPGARVKDFVMMKLEEQPESLARDIIEAVRVKYEEGPKVDPDMAAEEVAGCLDRLGELLEKEAYAGKGKSRDQLAELFKKLEGALIHQIEADLPLSKRKERIFSQTALRLCKIKVGIIASEFEKRKKSIDTLVDLTKMLLTDEEENKRIFPLLKSRLTLEGMSEEVYREMLEKAGIKPKDKEDRRREIRGSFKEVLGQVFSGLKMEEGARKEAEQTLLKGLEKVVERETRLEIHDLAGQNEALKYRVDRMDAILKSVADAIVVVNPKGEVVFINPAAEQLLGVKKERLLGKHVMSEISEAQMIALAKDHLGEAGTFEPTEVEVRGQRDTIKTLRQSVGVIHNKDGQLIGTVSVLSDVSKQKELDQLKRDFVAHVSHELRTPLVSIQKSLELILGEETGEISPEKSRFLQICNRNVFRLMRLINDILDISKIEAGKMHVNVSSVDVSKLVRESVAGLMGWAQSKNISIELDLEEGLPSSLWDYNKVIQAVTNIISNAIKYSPEKGMVNVKVKKGVGEKAFQEILGAPVPLEYPSDYRVEPSDEFILILVSDTGVGISQENLLKIFDKFYQIKHTSGDTILGTGLGLPIVRQYVQMHHGRLWISSKPNQGSTFTMALPVRDNSLFFK